MADNQFPSPPPFFSNDEPSTTPIPSENTPTETLPPPEEVRPIPLDYQAPATLSAPNVQPSPFRLIIPIVGGLILVGLIAFLGFRFLGNKSPTSTPAVKEPTTITYWGLWESPSIMKSLISAFEKDNPDIKVNYQMQASPDYQDRLQTALSSQKPPDVVRLHSTWLPVFYQKLLPAPANTVSASEIQTNFYPAAKQVILTNQVYGIPLTMESIALFINTKMFEALSLSIPKSWEDTQTAAKTLVKRDSVTNKITRGGIALGNTTNVDYWPDIVSLMLLQGGANLLNPNATSLNGTLRYYTSFSSGNNAVWDATLPESTIAFANEKVAMIFAPSWKAVDIQTINPSLSWKTVPVPQLPDVPPVNWTSFWIESVPKNSPHPQEAWRFLTYLSSAKAQQLLFESASKERGFSQSPAHKSVASITQQNPISAPFVEALPTAQTFYTASLTHDSSTALNSRLIKYLEDAVNGYSHGGDTNQVTDALIKGFNQVLSQYRLVNPLPTATK